VSPGREPPVVLFDGVCNLCDGFARFLIRHDPPPGRFRLAALQSDAGRGLLRAHGVPADSLDTLVLVEGDRVFVRSTAMLRILRRLGPPWSVLGVLLVVPRAIRDPAYDWIARRRYRWFGRRDACAVPGPDARARFLQ
jgi:predicted DCC family thiol-disulfide oxidoreductase YuxK